MQASQITHDTDNQGMSSWVQAQQRRLLAADASKGGIGDTTPVPST